MEKKSIQQAIQEAIYRVRWVDAFKKDGAMATDEAIAEAVIKALNEGGL
jgi:hypothetical protein